MELKGEQISLVLLAAVALEGEFVEISSLVRPRNAFRRRDARERRRSFAPKNSRPRHNLVSIRLYWDCQRLLTHLARWPRRHRAGEASRLCNFGLAFRKIGNACLSQRFGCGN